jgi:glutaminyl-tRNA synthetase
MPTISGLRRRGFTPEAIRVFAERIGVAKAYSMADIALLEHCLREDLNARAQRVMAVLRPLKVVITNYPEGQTEEFEAQNNPEDPSAGTRTIPFSRVLYIERDDFMEEAPKKFFRLTPGREVRLKNAYIIKCDNFINDEATGEVTEVHCTYDPETKSGSPQADRKVKGTLHWVSAEHAVDAEVRLYEHLFEQADPEADDTDFESQINPNSVEVLGSCKVEPSLKGAAPESKFQFMRLGYFCVDRESSEERPVFNRTVTLRDTWAKIKKKQ